MYSVNDIRNVRFSKSKNGYDQDEVDGFLDRVEADYAELGGQINALKAEVQKSSKELDELRLSQSSIQNVLVSAQKLADQIVGEAKSKAEEIIVEAKVHAVEANKEFEEKMTANKAMAEKSIKKAEADYVALMQKTAEKSEGMISAAHDSVARQQLLFDKLKLDIVNFKAQIMAIYKEHLDSLSKLPDEVPFDSTRAADAAAFAIDNVPDYTPAAKQEAPVIKDEAPAAQLEAPEQQQIKEETQSSESPKQEESAEPISDSSVSFGFQVQQPEPVNIFDEDDEDDEEEDEKPRGFFRRRR